MRSNDRPTATDEESTSIMSQRFLGGLLHGLASGVATLLMPRDSRREGEVAAEPFVPSAHEIGAGSVWGVGG
jgi:hypothetical protein